jgi:hypothetical protein
MRPCCEQEARDVLEDLGLVPDDEGTEDPTPEGPLVPLYAA